MIVETIISETAILAFTMLSVMVCIITVCKELEQVVTSGKRKQKFIAAPSYPKSNKNLLGNKYIRDITFVSHWGAVTTIDCA